MASPSATMTPTLQKQCDLATGGRSTSFMGLKAAITPGRNDMVDLARTFVSFSSADKGRYDLMCAWKAHEHINFNFADFQLDEAINSKTPYYIKSVCAAKVRRADTFVLLIGNDTYTKTVFVKDEVEVA